MRLLPYLVFALCLLCACERPSYDTDDLAAAQEANITRAAEFLHVTQPTLSRQIMELERELGVTLMLRGKSGLVLTDDGLYFRQRAEEIVELADRLEQAFM